MIQPGGGVSLLSSCGQLSRAEMLVLEGDPVEGWGPWGSQWRAAASLGLWGQGKVGRPWAQTAGSASSPNLHGGRWHSGDT